MRIMTRDLHWGGLFLRKGEKTNISMKNSGAFLVGAVMSCSEEIPKKSKKEKTNDKRELS